eukprot:TRINITY_DN51999_c0_g1_i1.p1 TRINITY_DN51999_c0_g1~~TRINITY_DN51999_c0_g1_i1.p1  ORF type:complete len:455 (+),score=163.23 TRINITY_DN51999_c0_g1_i1:85-1449(+)
MADRKVTYAVVPQDDTGSVQDDPEVARSPHGRSSKSGGVKSVSELGLTDGRPAGLSVTEAAVGLAQNIIGSGLLAMPYAFRSGGTVGASALLGGVAVLSIFTMALLPVLAEAYEVFSYKELAVLAGSQRLGTALEVLIFFYNMGICIGYCVFVGDFVSTLVGDHIGGHDLSPRLASVAVTVVFFWPLSCAKNLSKLTPLTFVGIAGIIYSLVAVIERYAAGTYANKSNPGWPVHMELIDGGKIGKTFPLLVVAMGAHFNILRFYQEMEDRTPAKMNFVICFAIILAAAVYGAAGMVVYATFGKCTKSDFTSNFDSDDTWITVVRCAMLFALIVSFPLVLLSARATMDALVLQPRKIELTTARRLLLATALTAVCLGIAVAAGDPGIVLDYNGSVFGTPVCYIFPPVLYLMQPRQNQGTLTRYGCMLSVGLGIAFAIFGVFEVTLEKVQGDDSAC